MALWRLYYHLVWATKERMPLITADIEPVLYGYLVGKAHALSIVVHALGGIEDHVHILASIPPALAVAECVKQLKGSSAHYLNHNGQDSSVQFGWQRGYGVFSFGQSQLDNTVQYVLNQKQHHTEKTMKTVLELCTHEDDGPTAWNHGKAIAPFQI